jgi:hypothetical protein
LVGIQILLVLIGILVATLTSLDFLIVLDGAKISVSKVQRNSMRVIQENLKWLILIR